MQPSATSCNLKQVVEPLWQRVSATLQPYFEKSLYAREAELLVGFVRLRQVYDLDGPLLGMELQEDEAERLEEQHKQDVEDEEGRGLGNAEGKGVDGVADGLEAAGHEPIDHRHQADAKGTYRHQGATKG